MNEGDSFLRTSFRSGGNTVDSAYIRAASLAAWGRRRLSRFAAGDRVIAAISRGCSGTFRQGSVLVTRRNTP